MPPIQLAPIPQPVFTPKNALKAVAKGLRGDVQAHFNRLLAQWAVLKRATIEEQQEKLERKMQRIYLLEGLLRHIEKRFPVVVRDNAEARENKSWLKCLCLCTQDSVADLKLRDVAIAERFLREEVLRSRSYEEYNAAYSVEIVDNTEDVPAESIAIDLSRKAQETGKTQTYIWGDPDCSCGFIISIGWYDPKTQDVATEHVHVRVCYRKSCYFLDCSHGTYRNRPAMQNVEQEVACIANDVLLLERQKKQMQSFPKLAEADRLGTYSAAARCALLFQKIALKERVGKNENPVYFIDELERGPGAVFKVVNNGHEVRAGRVCAWLRAPEALVSSCSITFDGLADDSGKKVQHRGIIKPLLREHILVNAVFKKTISSDRISQIFQRLDVSDTQKKAVVQALLAAWDLHAGNGSFVRVGAAYKVALFDNEYTLGGERGNLTAGGNFLIHWKGRLVLPVRSFFLAPSFANGKALTDDVQNWIKGLRKDRDDIAWAAFSGHHELWSRLSPHTRQELHRFLKRTNLFQPANLAGLPYGLQQMIAQDLGVSSKKWGMDQKSVQEKQTWLNWIDQSSSWSLTANQKELLQHLKNVFLAKFGDEGVMLFTYEEIAVEITRLLESHRKGAVSPLHADAGMLFQQQCKEFVNAACQWDFEHVSNEHATAYKKNLNDKLLPLMPFTEAKALMERIERAAEYIERGSAFQTELTQHLLSGDKDRISSLLRRANIIRVRRQCALDKIALMNASELQAYAPELRQLLSPTVEGLYMALFQFLEPVLDMLTKLYFITPCTILRPEYIKLFKKNFDKELPNVPELADIIPLVDTLNRIANCMNASPKHSDWGPAQAALLQSIYSIMEELVTSQKTAHCFDFHENQIQKFKEYYTQGREALAANAGKAMSEKEHNELLARLDRGITNLNACMQPVLKRLLNYPAVIEYKLQAIRQAILEERICFTENDTPYSQVPVDWVLDQALQHNLLPEGKDDFWYKTIQQKIQKMQPKDKAN